MFHHEDGLFLTQPRLAIDVRRRQPRAFVSHAHADHIARHELALCTRETAALYRHRLGAGRRVKEMPYGRAVELQRVQLTAHPAGHCLGAAMLHVDNGHETLLYTGDFKLGESVTAATADPPQADLLVMETTFGHPQYRLPLRGEVIDQLLEIVHQAFAEGRTPVVHAYALGKAQEVTALLTRRGVPVSQHPQVYAISRIYQQLGVKLSEGAATVGEYAGAPLAGHVVITLPKTCQGFRLAGLGPTTSIALTGWAMDPAARRRLRVDYALPLSDHADFDELVALVERVQPRRIATTHGPPGFDQHLRDLGYDAQPLVREPQRRLF